MTKRQLRHSLRSQQTQRRIYSVSPKSSRLKIDKFIQDSMQYILSESDICHKVV